MKPKRVIVLISIVLCSAGMALAQTEWVDHPDNPVIGVDDPGSWAPGGLWVNAVVHDGTTYHMWFTGTTVDDSGWITGVAVGHATSPDGVGWTMDPANPVIAAGDPGEWDDLTVDGGPVIYDGAQFKMWYTGWSEGATDVGYATSPDGSTWTKYSGNPVMEHGPQGSWDDHWLAPATVLVEDGTYRMWFHGKTDDYYSGQIGYAESPDGISWTKWPDPVFEPADDPGTWQGSFLFPSVVFDGTTYHMLFSKDPVNRFVKIGYAYSSDGIEWTSYQRNPVHELANESVFTVSALLDGDTWHMWYSHFGDARDSRVSYATSECCDLKYLSFIPAAALAGGSAGAFFMTDVDVSNAGSDPAEYLFKWLPRGQDNNDPLTSETFSLGANMSVRYTNVLSEVFGLEPNSLGALLVLSTSPDLLFMSRTYNAPSAKAGGTYGQAIPAVSYEDLIRSGERKRIVFGSETADLRTNVGCQNGMDKDAMIRLELFAADGASLGQQMMVLGPFANDQINRIFVDHQPVNGCVDVWALNPDSRFYCYGSVLDNITSDPTTIPPQ